MEAHGSEQQQQKIHAVTAISEPELYEDLI